MAPQAPVTIDAVKEQLANLRAQRRAQQSAPQGDLQRGASVAPHVEQLRHAGNGCAFECDLGDARAGRPPAALIRERKVWRAADAALEKADEDAALDAMAPLVRKRGRERVRPQPPREDEVVVHTLPAARRRDDVAVPPAKPMFPSLQPRAREEAAEGKAKEGGEQKSDCVKRVEAMAQMREERRMKAAAARAVREEEAKEAEGRGGIESVDFLNRINEYRRLHGLSAPAPWPRSKHIWDAEHGSSNIRVCVRKRPMLKVERHRHDFDIISAPGGSGALVVHEPRTKVDLTKAVESHEFCFDAFFTEFDGNEAIHEATLAPLLKHVLTGRSATVFAFGQTGSGKTCTMAGHGNHAAQDGNAIGLYELASRRIISEAKSLGLAVQISFYEVYRGKVLDLLRGRARLEVLEDGCGHVTVVGLHKVLVDSAEAMLRLVKQAEDLRAVGCTSANETSSRSHAILEVALVEASSSLPAGKLTLVDLAGSERAADSTSKDRQTRAEGAEINKSLLCLKECIRALDTGDAHTPFRGSKLTQVLRESFIGDAKTVMIATIAPGSSAAENTLNTLRYAQRVRDFSSKRPPYEPPRFGRRAPPPAASPPQQRPSQPSPPTARPTDMAPPASKPVDPFVRPRPPLAPTDPENMIIGEVGSHPHDKPKPSARRRAVPPTPPTPEMPGRAELAVTKDVW
ncbi:hypothetical protein AB1Y20_017547 [Prymnesium parvum]|uniref:Kinesin-like protein n=1 Tax=Prymnesium parvum TaxID=97485 RepID=A0AB34JPB6_PRYPA